VFRVLQAKHAFPFLPRPCLPPIYIILPCLTSFTSPLARRVGLCTNYSELPSHILSPVLLILFERPIGVTSVLFRRAQISSGTHQTFSSSLAFLILSSIQPTLPFVQLGPSLFAFPPRYLFFVTHCFKISSGFLVYKNSSNTFFLFDMATSLQPSISPTDTRPTSDELKQSPPAFLDLADSVSPSRGYSFYSSDAKFSRRRGWALICRSFRL